MKTLTTKFKSCYQVRSILLVPLIAMFLIGCRTSEDRLNDAASTRAQAGLVEEAIAAGQILPEMPKDCRRWESSGVTTGDRLDAALVKTDKALTKANLRVRRCYNWYKDIKEGNSGDG